MKKKLEDYLHLYLGCKCKWRVMGDDEWKDGGIDLKILDGVYDRQPFEVKPILRPLSDMTEEEGLSIAEILCGKQFVFPKLISVKNNPTTVSELTIQEIKFEAYQVPRWELDRPVPFIIHLTSWGSISHFIGGERSNCIGNNGYEMQMVYYLLSKGFDLFGLIDAGLALDKTKLQ